MFSVLIFSLTINLSSGFYSDSLKVVELTDTSYAENIRIADSSMTILNDCITAKKHYRTALSIRPNDSYALQKIDECNELLNQHACGYPGDGQYQKIVNKANEYFDTSNYLRARDFYLRAEMIRPSDIFVKERIAICNKNLEGTAEYNACIKEADAYFASERYLHAKEFYSRALTINGDADEYLKNQIILTDEKIMEQRVQEVETQYQLILNKADEYFQAGNYQKAKDFYSRAVLLKPTDTFAQERIKICDDKLKN